MQTMKEKLIAIGMFLCIFPSRAGAQGTAPSVYGIAQMKKRLNAEERQMLQKIYAPQVVGVPVSDARAYVCVMPDGEIRCYGKAFQTEENPQGVPVYQSSTDCGLSWKLHYAKGVMGAATYFPEWGLWVKCAPPDENRKGSYVMVSRTGPDDEAPVLLKVSDSSFVNSFLPQKMEGSSRIFFTTHQQDAGLRFPGCFVYSDDTARSFRSSYLPLPPQQEVVYPHKGVRWSIANGTEPYGCDIDGKQLRVLLRNSTDCFYQTTSEDGGKTWSPAEPSPFQGCNTTPFMLKLSDGRILVFWNNTRPLPEPDHSEQCRAKPSVLAGRCEDFFTNRDAAHVAVSEDGGNSWKGARELYLNSIRNRADFRYFGSPLTSLDKSVHQFQAIELPFHKVLVALGQNEAARKFIIFDVDWLYENGRYEDFYQGLANVSTQVYLKSVVGHTFRNGHCAYNRTDGAVKTMDPTDTTWEVVQLSRTDDPRLLSPIQGLVWNFPAAVKGELTTEIYLAEDAADLSLNDCWTNPCDAYAPEFSLFSFHIDRKVMKPGCWHSLRFTFDLEARSARLYIDGRFITEKRMTHDYKIGLSYINIQCNAPRSSEGLYVKYLKRQ